MRHLAGSVQAFAGDVEGGLTDVVGLVEGTFTLVGEFRVVAFPLGGTFA